MKSKIIFCLFVFMMLSALGCGKKSDAGSEQPKEEPKVDAVVKVELYIMSKCPYGVMALDGILPAVQKIGSAVGLKIDYIGKKNPDGSLESMHGEPEVDGDKLQLCAEKIGGTEKHLKFISCMNKDWQKIPTNWESCAKEAGLDAKAISACKGGADGKNLLAASFDRAVKANANGSPTIMVNGAPYQGGRKPDDFLRGICGAFGDKPLPKACKDIPPPAKVTVTVLTDVRCKNCEADKIVENLKQVFPGLAPNMLDWSKPEAQAIAKEADIKLLPAVLFDDSINQDKEGAEHMARWLDAKGKYKSLRVPAEFDPTAEICDNNKDDTGDGKVDCADATCAESMVCREEKQGQLEAFVMSQCPYGVMGLDAMKEVLTAFGKEMTFSIHYIAEETDKGIQSMHGQAEVDEDLRELCAMKHYVKDNKFMDYIWCRNKDIRSEDWKKCADDNKMSSKVIETCSTGAEGKKLLSDDLKIAKSLKIGGSPTWFVNNKVTFNGVAAADIQKNFCDKNQTLAGCKKQMSGAPASAPQGSCGN